MKAKTTYRGTVLKVDDYPYDIVRYFLAEKGVKMLFACDGEEGIQIAEQAQPDVILLDLLMPGINGFEVYQVLQSKEITKDIPVIFMFSKEEFFPPEILELEYMTKPIQPEEVWERIKKHLKQA